MSKNKTKQTDKQTNKQTNKQENNKRGKQSHSAGMQESKWGEGDTARRGAKQASRQPNM